MQLTENVPAAPLGIGLEPGEDLLSLSRKGGLMGAPPTEHTFSPLLLAVQGVEHTPPAHQCHKNVFASLLALPTDILVFADTERRQSF